MLYIERLKTMARSGAIKGMARGSTNPEGTLGVSIPNLRRLAKETGRDHELALKL